MGVNMKNKPKPIGTLCCWKCKRSGVTLTVCRDEDGKKTKDYVCENCKAWVGTKEPSIGNQSIIYNKLSKKEVEKIQKLTSGGGG